MAGRFVIKETNLNGFFDPEASLARFRPWVRFLNSQSLISTAITAHAKLQIQLIQDFYSTDLNTILLDNHRMSGEVHGGRTIHINTDDVNRIHGFLRENFIAHNRPVNFGKLILQAILTKLGPMRSRSVQHNAKVACFYPRFIMLFLNDKMTNAEKNHYFNSSGTCSSSLHKVDDSAGQ